MLALLRKLWKDEDGQGMVEYGLIIALVALAVIGLLITVGDELVATFTRIAGELGNANQ